MDFRHIEYSQSKYLLEGYEPFTFVSCNPYSVMPRSIYDYVTEYCYILDSEDRLGNKVFKHVFTETNNDALFTFYIYRVPADFKIPKTKEKFHMETKHELKQIIDELKEKLKEAQNKLENLDKNERFKPEDGQIYWYLNNNLTIESTHFCEQYCYDTSLYDTYNCFQIQEEAQREANKILIRRKLEDLAKRLNGDEKIDWSNENQRKYFINYDFSDNNKGLCIEWNRYMRVQGCIYCLDENFLKEARKEIGEKELISYLIND